MARHIVNPTISVNGTDISDHVVEVSVAVEAAEVETTAFGTAWRSRIGGLKTGSVTINYQNDFAASQASTILSAALGSNATVVVTQSSGSVIPAGTAIVLVTNVNPVNGAVGDLSTSQVTLPTVGTVTGFGL